MPARRFHRTLLGLATVVLCVGLAAARHAQVQPTTPGVRPIPDISLGNATGTAAISGVVLDGVSGQPLSGAVVTLARAEATVGWSNARMVTDARGRFVFTDLPAGKDYFLGARRFGYAYTRYGWASPNGSLTVRDIARVAVADGQWVDTIQIPLWRLGSIAGRVTDEQGEPVVGVAVRAFSTRSVAGESQLVAGAIATTDDRGVYRIAGLDPGRYLVAVLSVQSTVLATTLDAPPARAVGELETGGIGASSGVTVAAPTIDVDGRYRLALTNFVTPPPPHAVPTRAYPAVFYPNTSAATEATPVEINYNDDRVGIDLQMRPSAAVKVSGRVEGGPTPLPPVLLRLLPAGSERLGFGSEAATTIVEPDGRFTFLNVPEGNYTIVAQAAVMDLTTDSPSTRFSDAPGFPGGGIAVGSLGGTGLGYLARQGQKLPFWGRTTVTVGATPLTDVVLPFRPTTTIRGRILFAEGATPVVPPARVFMRAVPANGDPSLGYPMAHASAPNGTRDFTFEMEGLLGGRYILDVAPLGLVSVTSEGRPVPDAGREAGFDASRGRDFDDVVVTLTDKLGRLTGTVRDRNGPVIAAVLVFPADRDRWTQFGWSPARFRSARSGSDGSYQLTDVPAGDYFVIAVDVAHISSWQNARFLAAAAPLASRLSTTWADKKALDLSVVQVSIK